AFTDTVTYTITVCNNSVNTQTGILSDITPPGFVTTSTTLPPTVTLNSMECDTFTISGYFTTQGSCFYNVASVTSPMGTTWKDSVCVSVVSLCSTTDTTFADSTFSGNAIINNQSIFLANRFYINGNLTLNSCTVYTAAGAQLIVQNGGILTLNNTTLQACDTMWRGIEVLENGTTILNSSSIADAENGILLRNKGIIKSVNSNFYDNIIGINAQPELAQSDVYGLAHLTVTGTIFTKVNGFKPDYIQQYAHGTVPYCGILLNKMFCTIGDDNQNENYFSKMIYGIYSNNCDLTLTNSRFQYIYNHNSWMSKAKGTAVVSWGNSKNKLGSLKMRPVVSSNATIEQCDRGLYTTYSAVDVNRLIIKQVLTGVFTANCYGRDAKISYNTIEAKSYGIYLSRNEGSVSMDIEGNDITMQGSSKGVGITMDEWNNVQSANYNINANSITLWDAAFGIRSSYALKPQINYNNIYQNTNGSIKPLTTGIAILGSDTATISCNYMTTNYPADTNFVSKGLEIAQSKMFTANCNKIRYHNCGVYMGGDCQNNNIYRTNDVDSCDMGLYLNSAAIVGQQMQKGNRWLNVLNKVNAANFGDPSLSPIKIHTPVNTIWHPLNISPNGPWFISDTTGTPEQCGNSCYAAFTAAEDTLLLYSIARGDTLSTDFVEETKSIARQNLYDLLAQNDTLRLSDTVLTLFYNIHQTTDIGKFYTVKDSIKAASTMNGYLNTLLQLNDSLILQTKDSITIADSLMATDSLFYSTYKEQLIMQLNTLQSNTASLLLQLQNIQQSLWVNIKSDNQTISPTEIPEQNRKTMNDILASVWEDAADSLPSKYPALMAIALQCPYSGGVSVYQARNMLRLLDDSIQYDDRYSCLQQGIYRMGSTHDVIKNYAAIDFDLVPNPANGKTEVRILTPVDGLTKLTLRTMLGEMLEEWLLQNEKQFTIYTHHYLQGIYVVEAKDKQGFSRVKKLIIAR
ncbi:MAG TPA: T9SS type A sorting domain-containing protein, partial [Bacteroidia bacterium]|nr:T9SS type A sorting domain-containing protein [Bacteroidia bacterium]